MKSATRGRWSAAELSGRGLLHRLVEAAVSAPLSNYVAPTNTNLGAGAVLGIYISGGAAESYGIELSANYRATHELTFNGSFAWQHGTGKKGAIAPVSSTTCDDIVCKKNGDVSGNFLGNGPWLQGTFGFD